MNFRLQRQGKESNLRALFSIFIGKKRCSGGIREREGEMEDKEKRKRGSESGGDGKCVQLSPLNVAMIPF